MTSVVQLVLTEDFGVVPPLLDSQRREVGEGGCLRKVMMHVLLSLIKMHINKSVHLFTSQYVMCN